MQPLSLTAAYLQVNTLSIEALVDMRQAALDDAERLLELDARAQRARCDEAGQRAQRLAVQPGALLAAAQPFQVGIQLCDELVLAILTCQQKVGNVTKRAINNLQSSL